MTIDLSSCDKPQIKHGFSSIVNGAKLLIAEHPDEFAASLSEIETCFEKARTGDNEEPHWADVLLDIVLSFLPRSGGKSTALFVNGITTLASHVTPAVVESISAALTSTGQEDETDDGDDNEADDGDDSGDEEKESSDEEEAVDSEEEEVEEDETELDLFKQKLQKILSKNEEEEDEEVLGDQAMEGLDEALSDAFRERVGGKKADRLSKKEQDDFRCRVLSVYAAVLHKREVEVELIVPLVPVLLSFLRTMDVNDGSVSAKVLTIITRIKKLKHIQQSVHVEGVTEAIDSCFQMTTRNMPIPIQMGVAHLITWLIKVSKNTDSSREVEALVQKLAKESLDRKTTNKTLFTDLSRSNEAVASALIESRAGIAFDPNVKKQKRSLETEIIANALTTGLIPDSLFESLWKNVTTAVADLLAEEKPFPQLFSSSLKVMSHLKLSKQGEFREVDQEVLDKLASLSTKMRKKLHKSGQKALRTFVKYDSEKRAQDAENAKRRRDNPYLKKKKVVVQEKSDNQEPVASATGKLSKKSVAVSPHKKVKFEDSDASEKQKPAGTGTKKSIGKVSKKKRVAAPVHPHKKQRKQ